MKNKILATTLSTALILSMGTSAFAQNTAITYNSDITEDIAPMAEFTGALFTVNEVNFEQSHIVVQNEDIGELIVHISDDTYIIDNESGVAQSLADIEASDEIYIYHSMAMTLSLPAQTAGYAIVTNIEDENFVAGFYTVEEVRVNEDMSVTILADGGSINITIGAATNLSYYDNESIMTKPIHFEEGANFFAWYDIVLGSYPAQTYADKAVLLPTEDENGELPIDEYSYRNLTMGEITEIGEDSITVKTDFNSILTFMTQDSLGLDYETNLPLNLSNLEVGDDVFVYHGQSITANDDVFNAQFILTGSKEATAPKYVTVEHLVRNSDGTITITTDESANLYEISSHVSVSPFLTKNIVTLSDIHMGTNLLMWIDEETNQAERLVIVPHDDYEFTIIREGDIAIGKGYVENSVAMVPLRLMAETFGYTVTWDANSNSIKLENDENSVHLYLDSADYSYSSKSMITTDVMHPLSAPAYINDEGVTYVPADFFNEIGFSLELYGTTMYS